MKAVHFLRNSLTGKCALAVLILIAGAFAITTIYPVTPSEATPKMAGVRPENFTELSERYSPAVVNIRAERDSKGMRDLYERYLEKNPLDKNNPFHDFFEKFFGGGPNQNFKQRSLGSGFIIDEEGFIVTNNHVIKGANKIKVIMKDEREFDAEIKGRDPNTDLALIKINPDKDLPVIKMGNSDDIKVGEWVVAIGNPFGLGHTVTAGIISAKGRVIGAGPYDDFLQTDASINPGNSGGPLIDLQGNVVGINTAIIAGGQGIGFAIPVNLAKGIIEQLKTQGEVIRGWLGVGIQDLDKDLREYYGLGDARDGVLVTQVFPDDPADKAGIELNDIILEVDGQKVDSSRELSRMIADFGVGEEVKILVWRDGKKKAFTVELGKRKDLETASVPGEPAHKELFGIKVADITPETARQFNLKDKEGVVVVGVEPGSKGEEAGIQPGDFIKEINHKTIDDVKAYKEEIDKVASGKPVYMYALRPQKGFMVIKLTK
ncbi:MAG: Do family serine endopeptidase [Deltaproteobacteria bacterium]|nr:Do family serine endopeptidase [Deltaproteobacteria bacterium]